MHPRSFLNQMGTVGLGRAPGYSDSRAQLVDVDSGANLKAR
jgi:hypothetical protein